VVEVGRAGLFKMFGHDHHIEVRSFTGSIDWNAERPEESSFRLEVDAASLTVADEGLSEDDRGQVQSDMEKQALALAENPTIVFQSTEVRRKKSDGATQRLEIAGTLALRGVSGRIEVPASITADGGRLRIAGEIELDAGNWGVPQISAMGGSIKTSEKLNLSFDLVAVR
jgi:polyisoprenoid-binding protein YceI